MEVRMVKKAVIASGLLVVVLFAAGLFLPRMLGPRLVDSLITAAKNQNMLVSMGKIDYQGNAVSVVDLDLALFRPPLYMKALISELRIRLNLIPLLYGDVDSDFQGTIYSGRLDGRLQVNLFSKVLIGSVGLKSLQLAQHPQINGLGITGGTLNFSLGEFRLGPKEALRSLALVELKDVEKPQLTRLTRIMSAPLEIPAVHNLNLWAKIGLEQARIDLIEFEMRSSLGTAQGTAALTLSPGAGKANVDAEFAFELSESGQALMSQLTTSEPQEGIERPRFRLLMRGTLPHLQIQVTDY